MATKDGNVFLSYRRSDSAEVIGRIYDRLVQEFGKAAVFKDIDSIPLGIDFRTHLDQQVGSCTAFIAIIGPQWVNATDTEGNRRLDTSDDFVRIEVESALAREIPVIPLLVSGAQMPTDDQLPASLQNLAYRNGTQVRPDPDFHHDMDRIIAGLADHLPNRPLQSPSLPPIDTATPPPSIGGNAITINAGGDISNVSGIVGGDVSGVLNLGTISGDVTNTINQLPEADDDNEPGLKERLLQLQAAVEAESALDPEDKADVLEQIQVLAEVGSSPKTDSGKKRGKTALKVIRGTLLALPETANLMVESKTLLPEIEQLSLAGK